MAFKKILTVLAGCGAIFAALILVDAFIPQTIETQPKPVLSAPVSVVQVIPSEQESSLTLLATTSARWPIKLKASSSAQLDWLRPDIEPGIVVKKGTQLARLNTSALESNLAQANSELKQAELSLKQAQHEQTVALKMLSPSKSSPFARREPQVAAAHAELIRAKLAYASAKKLLEEANIVAPFDAIIMGLNISPGEWLAVGQVLFELAASDSVDIELPVSELHWLKVRSALVTPEIQIVNRAGNQWPAKVRYVAPQADLVTRQRRVVLFVSDPYRDESRLLSNLQVKVVVNLGLQDDIATLPLSAMTRDGYVWTLDDQNRLQKEWVTLVGQQQNELYVRFEREGARPRRVVLYPLLSMLPGKQVTPQATQILMTDMDATP
jgi:RND family efflux transporter MFP subunit